MECENDSQTTLQSTQKFTFKMIFKCNNVPTASRGRFIQRYHFQTTRKNPDHPHPVEYLSTLRNHKCPCISCRLLRTHTHFLFLHPDFLRLHDRNSSNALGAGFWFIHLIFSASVASSLYQPCPSGSGTLTIGDNDFVNLLLFQAIKCASSVTSTNSMQRWKSI